MIAGGGIGVAEGRDGWLFLDSVGGGPVLSLFADTAAWREAHLPRLAANFAARSRRVRAMGLPFLVVVAPEASGIMVDKLPPGRTVDVPTRGEQFAERLRAEGVDVVCPSAALRAAAGPVPTYQSLDSHWSPYGAFLCWEAMKPFLPTASVGWRDVRFTNAPGFGDLSVQMVPERTGTVQYATLPGIAAQAGPNVFDRRERNVRRTACAAGHGRALVFRDSFGNALAPYLERAFAEAILVGGSPAMPTDAIELFQPDIVILEIAERTLLLEEDAFADWPVQTFAQLHYDRIGHPAGGRLQVESSAALAEGRIADAIAAAAVAVALEGPAPRVHNLAQALLDAGAADPAKTRLGHALCAALAPGRNDRYLHYLHARLAYALGHEAEALTALGRAIELQPDNALYAYQEAVWHYLAGRRAEALAPLRRSLAHAPAFADTWRLALDCARVVAPDDVAALTAQAAAVFPGRTF